MKEQETPQLGQLNKILEKIAEDTADKWYNMEQISGLKHQLGNQNIFEQHTAIMAIRKIIVNCRSYQSLKQIIKMGVIPVIIEIAMKNQLPCLQIEAVRIVRKITNKIIPAEYWFADYLIEHKTIQMLVQFLRSNNDQLMDECFMAIQEIGKLKATFRDRVIEIGLKDMSKYIRQIMELKMAKSYLKSGCIALCTLFCDQRPLSQKSNQALLILIEVIAHFSNLDILIQVVQALAKNLTNEVANKLINGQAFNNLINNLYSNRPERIGPSLILIRSLIDADPKVGRILIDRGTMGQFISLISHNRLTFRIKAIQIMQGISLSSQQALVAVINQRVLMKSIKDMCESNPFHVATAILEWIRNIVKRASYLSAANFLISCSIIDAIYRRLKLSNKIQQIVLFDTLYYLIFFILKDERRNKKINQLWNKIFKYWPQIDELIQKSLFSSNDLLFSIACKIQEAFKCLKLKQLPSTSKKV